MRILLTRDFLLDRSDAGGATRMLTQRLRQAGHECECLVVDDRKEPFLERPHGGIPAACGSTFAQLTDLQLANYREFLRHALDRQVRRFDPQVIHCQYVWLLGHLALESGVPYVLTACGPELTAAEADPRCRALAAQAAENAGRIIVPDESIRQRLLTMYDDVADRIDILPLGDDLDVARLTAIYERVLESRFGKPAN